MGHPLPAVSLGFENRRSENRDRSQWPISSSFRAPNLAQRNSLHPQDVSDVTAALSRALETGTQPPASIIHAATEFARILTGAQGVALGIRIKGIVVCRARSGDLAPELGSALNADSGISGQCLRSESVLVCHDAEADERVDSDACRALGVRSIVAVPMRGTPEVVGLLEAFSGQPSAFAEDQIDALRALTNIIEAAHACELNERENREREKAAIRVATRRELFVKRATPGAIPRTTSPVIPGAIGEDKLSRNILGEPALTRRYWIAAIATAALLLGSLAVWLSWRDPTPDAAASDAPASAVPQKIEAKPAVRHTTFFKPDAGIALPHRQHGKESGVLHKAAEVSPLRTKVARESNSILPPEEVGEGFIGSASNAAEPSHVGIASSINAAAITRLVSTTEVLPSLETRASQGVTEARLIHQVAPNYPAQARTLRLAGNVTLNVTVAEDGSVRNVGVVNGPSLLAAAAIEAVRQWRYTPSLLNGSPVAVEKQITVVFKLP
jgi:periplasmic protein TonB